MNNKAEGGNCEGDIGDTDLLSRCVCLLKVT